MTTLSPLPPIPTLATTLANFEFPSEDQKEHETVQLVHRYRGRGRAEKYMWGAENNRGLTKEGLWGLTRPAAGAQIPRSGPIFSQRENRGLSANGAQYRGGQKIKFSRKGQIRLTKKRNLKDNFGEKIMTHHRQPNLKHPKE